MTINKIYDIMGFRYSVFCDNTEIIKNFIILSIGTHQPIPPFDHFVYTFEAKCDLLDFHAYGLGDRGGHAVGSILKFYINDGTEDIPFYIDSYEVKQHYISQVGHDFSIPLQGSEVEINGHFDSRDFEEYSHNNSCGVEKKKKPESVNSRFDILDL